MRACFISAGAFCILSWIPTAAAKDVYLPIAGSVGVFRTDTRIFNPSGTRDAVITATFLPAGQNNSGAQGLQVTVGKRQMLVLDDVVTSLFSATGLGAIRLSSSDDFVASSRIYAGTSAGTLGQFSPGVDATTAKAKGLIIQLKATGVTQSGTFRTNMGFVNPNSTATTVTIRTYDANNALVGSPAMQTIQPFSVAFPVTIDFASGNLRDAWVSYEASQAIMGFASVVDNGTTDPTFIGAVEDTGTPVAAGGKTKLYLGPILNFRLNTAPPSERTTAVEVCFSSSSWTATLAGDMAGTDYTISLGVKTAATSSGAGSLIAEIIHRRGSTDTVLASTTFSTSTTYEVKRANLTGPDPDTRAGDVLLLRTRIGTPSPGLPCVAEFRGPGTDNFIEAPQLTLAP